MADTNCSFSIIIPTFNRADLLCQCLDRLDGYFESGIQNILGLAIEVIVTDDARQPELRSLLEQRYPCGHRRPIEKKTYQNLSA